MNTPELPGISLTFLYYFSTTGLLVLLLLAQGLGLGWERAIAYQLASSIAAIIGIIGTVQNRSVTRQFSIHYRAKDEQHLNQALTAMGLTEQEPWQDFVAYRSTGRWNRQRVFVKWEKRSLTVVGRAYLLRRLQSQLLAAGINQLSDQ